MNPLKLFIYLHFGLEKLKMSNIDSTNSVIVYIRLSDRSETDMLTSSASLNVNVYSHNYMYVYNDRYTVNVLHLPVYFIKRFWRKAASA